MDQIHHLAKVMVAGSNPVFRSFVFRSLWACALDAVEPGLGPVITPGRHSRVPHGEGRFRFPSP
jgi:hypothetical protein